jgi:hypothetical protein
VEAVAAEKVETLGLMAARAGLLDCMAVAAVAAVAAAE